MSAKLREAVSWKCLCFCLCFRPSRCTALPDNTNPVAFAACSPEATLVSRLPLSQVARTGFRVFVDAVVVVVVVAVGAVKVELEWGWRESVMRLTCSARSPAEMRPALCAQSEQAKRSWLSLGLAFARRA